MKLKLWQKNILSTLIVVAGGFILFNLAFIMTALVTNAAMKVLGMAQNQVPPVIGRVLSLLLIFLISWLVFRSRLNSIIKATFLTMPLMVILVMLGISLYQQPMWMVIGAGAMVICAATYYIYKKKLPWLYYFSTFYVTALAIYILFSGTDI